jgi:hypothetical protein
MLSLMPYRNCGLNVIGGKEGKNMTENEWQEFVRTMVSARYNNMITMNEFEAVIGVYRKLREAGY